VSRADPPALPDDELHARLAARESRDIVRTLSAILIGAGLLLAVAVAAMIVVAS
jgi:hypothetical protein